MNKTNFTKTKNGNWQKERMDIFFPELVKQCEKYQCFEFEYYWKSLMLLLFSAKALVRSKFADIK